MAGYFLSEFVIVIRSTKVGTCLFQDLRRDARLAMVDCDNVNSKLVKASRA